MLLVNKKIKKMSKKIKKTAKKRQTFCLPQNTYSITLIQPSGASILPICIPVSVS